MATKLICDHCNEIMDINDRSGFTLSIHKKGVASPSIMYDHCSDCLEKFEKLTKDWLNK